MNSMLPDSDLIIETVPVRPKGGQQVGIIPSRVQVTHKPTGIIASCGTERSQMKNKKIALDMIEYGLAEIGWFQEQSKL